MIDAASKLVAEVGYENLTVRAVANRLDVSHMAIYRHVRDKDDLVFEVADRIIARSFRPRRDHSDWRRWTMDAAHRLRALMQREPVVLYSVLSHPIAMHPAGMRARNSYLEAVRAAFDDERAWRIVGAVLSYTVGFTALEAARASWMARHPDQWSELDEMGTILRPPGVGPVGSDEQFDYGLRMLLDGIPKP